MRTQGYGTAAAVLYETLVRACSARYAREHHGEEAGRSAVDYERSRGFVWMGDVYVVLAEYEADRTTYPSLTEFMPKLVTALNEVASRAAEMVAAYEAGSPRIVMTTPDKGGEAPAMLGEITFTFDQPMKSGYTVSLGSGSAIPKLTQPGWDATGTVFRLECALEPGEDYVLVLNASGGNFLSAEGYALRAYTLSFRTAE
jgi:hypothetical protein